MPAGRRRLRPAVAGTAVLALALLAACQSAGRSGAGSSAGGQRFDAVDPQQLLGAGESQVSALMGQPELRRVEAPAEVWQYRTGTCVFDVFFYGSAGAKTVNHYEARHRQQGSVNAANCLGEITARRGSPGA